MVDDGGSTGVLRDELGVLPPGDIRQCLVALSDSPKVRDLFQYRFDTGTFQGHSFGNVLLSALEKITGDFSQAIDTASEILHVRGVVAPATFDNVRLKMTWHTKSLVLNGERVIDNEYFKHDPRKATLSLIPKPKPNPTAIAAIEQADLIIVAPGDLYTSLGPLLVINGIGKALQKTKAKKVYVANMVTKQGQTDGFTVSDHAKEIERFAGGKFLDFVLYNKEKPTENLAKRYKAKGEFITKVDIDRLNKQHYHAIGGEFIGKMAKKNKGDSLIARRSLIRHDGESVIKLILELINKSD